MSFAFGMFKLHSDHFYGRDRSQSPFYTSRHFAWLLARDGVVSATLSRLLNSQIHSLSYHLSSTTTAHLAGNCRDDFYFNSSRFHLRHDIFIVSFAGGAYLLGSGDRRIVAGHTPIVPPRYLCSQRRSPVFQ